MVFVAAHKLHVRKIFAITIMLGALLGIPAVSLTLRQVQPVFYYQGRYMLPLVAVALLIWLTRRDRKIFFRSPSRLILLVGIVTWANSMALRQIIRRYSLGLADNTIIGFGSPKWWPWAISPTTVWALGSLAMLVGVIFILFVTIRSAAAQEQIAEPPTPVTTSPDFFDFDVPTTAQPDASEPHPTTSSPSTPPSTSR